MGKFRKIEIDDKMPCNKDMEPLIPKCDNLEEIWPAIITKAIIKLFSYKLNSYKNPENIIGDVQIIHALTGYFGEVANIRNSKFDIKKNLLKINICNKETNTSFSNGEEKYFILCFNFKGVIIIHICR